MVAGAFTGVTVLCFGALVLDWFRIPARGFERLFLAFALGAAGLSTLVFAVIAIGLARTPVFLAAGLAIAGAALWRRALRFEGESIHPLLAIVFGGYAVLYMVNAMLPEVNPDAVVYHIPVVARYLKEHHLVPIPATMLADFPMGTEMLFLFAYAFGNASAPATVHLLFAFALGLGILSYGRRVGSPVAGGAAAALVFVSPIVGRDGTAAYIDVAAACLIFAAYYFLEIWREDGKSANVAAAGLLCGFCVATKYTAAMMIPYAAGFVAFYCWRMDRRKLRPLTILLACAVIPIAPWLVKNALFTGNPIAPIGNRIFPNPHVYVFVEQALARNVSAHLMPLWRWPFELAVTGERTTGTIGPVFLLAPLLLLTLRQAAGRRLAAAAVYFSLVYAVTNEARFMIPALPFLALGIGLALARWRTLAAVAVMAQAILCWPDVLRRYNAPGVWRLDSMDWRAALRIQPEDQYLRAHIPDYGIGLLMDKVIPPGDLVFHIAGLQALYQAHDVIGGWQSALGVRLDEALRTPLERKLQPTWLHDFRFERRTASRIVLVQEANSDSDRWSITEIRFLAGGMEVPQKARWIAGATPNRWDANLALDGNLATRWTTGQPFRSGMRFQIDFGGPETFDEVAVTCTRDQPTMRMTLHLDGASISPVLSELPVPQGLRRQAIAYLRSNKVYWLVGHELESGGADFRGHSADWNLTAIASEAPYTIYKVSDR